MLSEPHGNSICAAEVTSIGRDGFWLICNGREYFTPFDNYPVFRMATIEQIYSMQEIAPGQLRWESLDADIEVAALENPEYFQLKFAA